VGRRAGLRLVFSNNIITNLDTFHILLSLHIIHTIYAVVFLENRKALNVIVCIAVRWSCQAASRPGQASR
jgi:hypothetical protein